MSAGSRWRRLTAAAGLVASIAWPTTSVGATGGVKGPCDLPVSTLVLTYGHEDHVLGVQAFAARYLGLEILTREETRDYLEPARWRERVASLPSRAEARDLRREPVDPAGEPEGVQSVRRYFEERSRADAFSGVVLVARGGEPILELALGWAEREHEVPMRSGHIFRIGSLTKPFTASAVLLAVHAGRLALDSRICALLDGCPASWTPVTLDHLLTHRSGIRDHFGNLDEVPVEQTLAELRRVLATLEPTEALESEPGAEYDYSNFNYVLLGAALEIVYRRPWEMVLRELILEPLGLEDTAYDRVFEPVPRRVRGYDRAEDGSVQLIAYEDHAAYAAGGLFSTVDDLLGFTHGVVSGELLGNELTRRTFTPAVGTYGYGWQVREFFGRRVFNHTGGIDGFSSHVAHYPDEETTLIVLSNVESDSAILAACDAAALLFDWPAGPGDRSELPPRVRCGLPPA